MTHADGYFAIGKTHTVCQDYVRCGTFNGQSYVIVSDGCSGSEDTDIGARVLTIAAEQYLRKNGEVNFEVIVEVASNTIRGMGMDPTCLDATLLIAIEIQDAVAVYMMGDGVVVARNRETGGYYHIRTNFFLGAPFYPNYLTDPDRLEGYHALPANQVVEIKGMIGGSETDRAIDTDKYPYWLPVAVFNKSEYDLVVLMSDGAMSFRKDGESVPVPDVVTQIMDVKVPFGEFMTRRARKFLGSFCPSKGWVHDDDFGVGAIFVEVPDVTT
jgi:hypothetical protein